MSETPISPLRARMIEDMSVRKFGEKTQNDYIRHVKSFSSFLGRSAAVEGPAVSPTPTPMMARPAKSHNTFGATANRNAPVSDTPSPSSIVVRRPM